MAPDAPLVVAPCSGWGLASDVMPRGSILLSRSVGLEQTVSASTHRPYCIARSTDEVLMLVGMAPRSIIVDLAHADAHATLSALASRPLDERTMVIAITEQVAKEAPVGAHVLATPASLQRILDGVPAHEQAPQLERMMQLTVLGGQLDEALERAADELASCLGVDRCVIALRGDSIGGAASGAHTWDSFTWARTSERCRAASLASATLIVSTATSPAAYESYLAAPLDNPLGTFGFVGVIVEQPVVFSREQRSVLTAIAARISTELAWRAVHQRTTDELDRLGNAPGHDLLLGIWNRIATLDLANVYVSGSRRSGIPLSSMPVSSSENVVRIADPVADANLCAWAEGLLEQIVVLSGGRAPIVDHEACVTRGDAACLYRVVWNRPS